LTAEERVFAEPWEAQAFALVVSLNERGLFTWDEWTQAVAAAPEEGYYERWLATLERLLQERGETDAMTLARYRRAWSHAAGRTPHGTPIELAPEDFTA
jgi:nitrile hydratase accessory protein